MVMSGNCRRFVELQAECPPLEGRVSFERGFIPPELTPEALNSTHAAWDELAEDLPRLFLGQRAYERLAAAPVLSAEIDALSDADLTRAGVVLAALAHGCWRFGASRFFPRRITEVPTQLPDSVRLPWCQVSRRLGRHEPERPFQSFNDLFLSNYRLRPGLPADAPRIIENMDVLVATFRNEAERVFYMSFVEMHYHLTPLVGVVCEIEEAIERRDIRAVTTALHTIEACLVRATAVWGKISARAGSRVYCDPVLWSKTAAILGVPPNGMPQGATSGACAPMLYVLDLLLDRASYASHYGQFLWNEVRQFVARPVRAFGELAQAIPLTRFSIEQAGSAEGRELSDALAAVFAAYSGEQGWLGRHTAKVFNYLCISTITGRNASVSGDERYFGKQTWVEASTELHESRKERHDSARPPGGCPFRAPEAPACPAGFGREAASCRTEAAQNVIAAAPELPGYSRFEVARHHGDDNLWLIIDQAVYDVSAYLAKHPGGAPVLQAYAGQDVTEIFNGLTTHDAPAVRALLQRFRIGRVLPNAPDFDPKLYAVLSTLIRCHQSSRLQFEHAMGGMLGLKLFSDENAHMLLLEENLPAVFELLDAHPLWEFYQQPSTRAVRADAQRFSAEIDFSGSLSPEQLGLAERRLRLLAELDLGLTARLLAIVFDFAAAPASELDGAQRHSRLATALLRELAAYFETFALAAGIPRPPAAVARPASAALRRGGHTPA
jgi:cytochrome b involved in lipid metabolism